MINNAWSKLVDLAKDGKSRLAMLSPRLLVNPNKVDCVVRDNRSLRIISPSGSWPALDDANKCEAVWERFMASQGPVE